MEGRAQVSNLQLGLAITFQIRSKEEGRKEKPCYTKPELSSPLFMQTLQGHFEVDIEPKFVS